MKRLACVVLMFCILLPGQAAAQAPAPSPILPDNLSWVTTPVITGGQIAWVLGGERKPGAYLVRIKLAGDAKIFPHTHPDERNTTVLSGTIYVGFGETFDERNMIAIPAGAVYVAPANVPHYIWAKGGEAMYQESGVGPTDSRPVRP